MLPYLLRYIAADDILAFAGLSESLEKDAVGWVSLTSSALPEKSSLPRPWHRLQPVLWLLLVAALRLDKVRVGGGKTWVRKE